MNLKAFGVGFGCITKRFFLYGVLFRYRTLVMIDYD